MKEIVSCVDRITDGMIACVDDEAKITRHLKTSDFPTLKEGDVLRLTLDGDRVIGVLFMEDETARRRQIAKTRLHSLFNRPSKN